MAIFAITLSSISVCVLYLAWKVIYNVYFHPLSSFPGPLLARSSLLWWARAILKGTIHHDVKALHDKYGEVVRVSPSELSFVDPVAWKEVWGHRGARGEVLKDADFYHSTPELGNSIIATIPSQEHGDLRRLFSHGSSEQALRAQEPIVVDYVNILINRLYESSHTPVDLVQWYNYFTFDVIGQLAYGESFGCLRDSAYHPWVTDLLSALHVQTRAVVWQRLKLPQLLARYLTPKSVRDSYASHMAHTTALARNRMAKGDERTDLVWKATSLPEYDFISNTHVLVIAGGDTTATFLSSCTYLLLKHPDTYRKLTNEIPSAFTQSSHITYNTVSGLRYLNAVNDEALRMCPPAGGNQPRRTQTFETIAGHDIPPNSVISIYQWSAAHSAYNFARPDEFIPERWLKDSRFDQDRRAISQPFSYGPRNCIGRNLAYFEMRLELAKILFHFNLHSTPETSGWWESLRLFSLWDKKPLPVRLVPIKPPVYEDLGHVKS